MQGGCGKSKERGREKGKTLWCGGGGGGEGKTGTNKALTTILCYTRESGKWKLLSHVQLFVTPWVIVHVILQARILEWVAFPFFRGSSQPRDGNQVSCIASRFFTSWATLRPSFISLSIPHSSPRAHLDPCLLPPFIVCASIWCFSGRLMKERCGIQRGLNSCISLKTSLWLSAWRYSPACQAPCPEVVWPP